MFMLGKKKCPCLGKTQRAKGRGHIRQGRCSVWDAAGFATSLSSHQYLLTFLTGFCEDPTETIMGTTPELSHHEPKITPQ